MIAGISQLGERQTEDLKVMCPIHVHRTFFTLHNLTFLILILAWIAQGERHIKDLKVTFDPRSLH